MQIPSHRKTLALNVDYFESCGGGGVEVDFIFAMLAFVSQLEFTIHGAIENHVISWIALYDVVNDAVCRLMLKQNKFINRQSITKVRYCWVP